MLRQGVLLSFVLFLLAVVQADVHKVIFRVKNEFPSDAYRRMERREHVVKPTEDILRQRFQTVLGEKFKVFALDHIEVHGIEVKDPLTVFEGYLHSKLGRAELIEQLNSKSSPITVFYVLPVDNIPEIEFEQELLGAAVYRCYNGGVLFPNNTCNCPPFYSGDQCETHNCANGGILDSSGKCNCAPGFQSEHCEPRSCAPTADDSIDLSTSTSFFTINLKVSMAQDLSLLNNAIYALLQGLNYLVPAFPNYYESFVLTTFLQTNNNGTYMKTTSYTSATAFIMDLQAAVLQSGTAKQPIFTAAAQNLATFSQQKGNSHQYVFVDSEASDATTVTTDITSNAIQNQYFQSLLYWRIRPIFFLTNVTGDYSTNTPTWQSIYWIAVSSHGDTFLLSKRDISNVISEAFPLFVHSENFYIANAIECDKISIVPPTDAMATSYVVMVYDPDVVVNGVFANDTAVKLTPRIQFSNAKLYSVTYKKNYAKINVKSGTPGNYCGVRAWIQTPISVLNTFYYNANFDTGDIRAIQGITGLKTGVVVTGGNILENNIPWEVVSTNDTTSIKPIEYLKKTSVTDTCTFVWTTNSTFVCTPGAFTSRYNIDGQDHLVPNFCATAPTITPASLKCQNSGVITNGVCVCKPGWTGNVCQTPICVNGGTVNVFPGNGQPSCICNPGYTGTFCDTLICNQTSTDDVDVTTRSFAIAVSNTYASAHIGDYIAPFVQAVLNDSSSNGYYTEYILTTFRQLNINASAINTEKTNDKSSFLNALNIPFMYTSVSNSPVMSALENTLFAMAKPHSSLYLFIETDIRNENVTIDDVKKFAIERQIRINIVIIAKYGDYNQCVDDESLKEYQDLAMSTGGIVIDFCIQGMDMQTNFNFLSSFVINQDYMTEPAALYVQDCTNPVTLSYQKFDPSQKFYVIANAVHATSLYVAGHNSSNNVVFNSTSGITSLGVYDTGDLTGNVTVIVSGGAPLCFIAIIERSPLAAFVSYSTDAGTDSSFASPQLQHALYPSVRLSTSLQYRPTVTISASLKNASNTPIYTSSLIDRQDSCLYDLFSPSAFACTSPNEEFFITVTAMTPQITVNRVARSFCRVENTNCLNGGTYNGTVCICPRSYSGKNCEAKNCQQGMLAMGVCVCNAGFTGEFCEYSMCDSWNYLAQHSPRTHNFRTVAFGLEFTTNNKDVVTGFIGRIAMVMQEIAQDDVFTQYVLVTYDETNVRRRIITPDPARFIAKVQSLTNETMPTAQQYVRTDSAITQLHALSTPPASQNPANIIILTATSSNQPSDMKTVAFRNREGVQINVFYYMPSPPTVPAVKNFDFLNIVTYQSGGRFMFITSSSIAYKFDTIVGSLLRAQNLVGDVATLDCSTGPALSIPVESSATELYIDVLATGSSGIATDVIFDGANKSVMIGASNIMYADAGSAIYVFKQNDSVTFSGTWLVKITSAVGRCQVQARVRSPIRVIPGFTESQHDDFPSDAPPYRTTLGNNTCYATGQIRHTNSSSSSILTGVDLYSKNISSGSLSFLYTYGLSQRYAYGCTNQYISELMKLAINNNDFQILYRGTDSDGSDFSRTFIFSQVALLSHLSDACVHGSTDNYGFCKCTDQNWTGTHCDMRVCQNGGTIVGTACLCPTSYYGDFCEKVNQNGVN